MTQDRDNLFGKLAFREGLVTDLELEECLKAQAKAESKLLGEVMVDLGYVSKVQVAQILRKQNKVIMTCDACSLHFTVLVPKEPVTPSCPKCRAPLTEHRPPRSLAVNGEIDASAQETGSDDMNMTRAVFSIDPEDVEASMEPPEPASPAGPPKKKLGKRDSRIEPGKKRFSDTMKGLPPTRPFTSVIRKPKGTGGTSGDKAKTQARKAALCPICKNAFEGTVDSTGHMRCISCHTRFKAK